VFIISLRYLTPVPCFTHQIVSYHGSIHNHGRPPVWIIQGIRNKIVSTGPDAKLYILFLIKPDHYFEIFLILLQLKGLAYTILYSVTFKKKKLHKQKLIHVRLPTPESHEASEGHSCRVIKEVSDAGVGATLLQPPVGATLVTQRAHRQVPRACLVTNVIAGKKQKKSFFYYTKISLF